VSGQLHAPATLPPRKQPPGTHWILLCVCLNICKGLFYFSTKIINQDLNAGPFEREALSIFIVKDDRKNDDDSSDKNVGLNNMSTGCICYNVVSIETSNLLFC
jgi:hypothetical protein